jgi:hypothetical protein
MLKVDMFRIRYQKSLWFRALTDSFCLIGDRGYRGLEYVYVCEDKPDKSVRQVVEAVNSQIKVFNGVSRWRNITTLLAYLQGYAVGHSFFRKSQIWR